MANTSSIDLAKTSEVAEHKIGTVATVGNTDYIYLKNRSSATEQGAVFAYDPVTYTWETWASNANLTGLVRPLAVFNANRNASNFVASTKDLRNFTLQSQTFDNATWTKTRSTISANSTVAPDGTTTADSLIEDDTAADSHQVRQTIAVTNNSLYRYSIYAKAGTRSWIGIQISFSTSTGNVTYFNLSACTLGSVATNATATITNVGNGWCLCTVLVTTNATSGFTEIRLSTGNNVPLYNGDNASLAYVWGQQLNYLSDATDYAVTTTAQYHDVPSAINVPASHYAWAAVRGEIQVTVLGSCVKNVPLYTSATAGYLDDTSSSQTLIEGVFIENTNDSVSYTRLMQAYAIQPMRS
jgi:hypothetical protein